MPLHQSAHSPPESRFSALGFVPPSISSVALVRVPGPSFIGRGLSTSLSPHQRSSFLQYMGTNRIMSPPQPHNWTRCGEWETEYSALSGIFFLNQAPPLKTQRSMLKKQQQGCKFRGGEWLKGNGVFPTHNRAGCTLELTETDSAGQASPSSNQRKPQHWDWEGEADTLGLYWKRERKFSLIECYWIHHSRAGSMPRGSESTQNGFHVSYMLFKFLFYFIFVLIGSVCLIIPVFLVCLFSRE